MRVGTIVAIQHTRPATTEAVRQTVTTVLPLVVGDYVELIALHTAGAALDIQKANEYSPEFSVALLTP